jgi:hypothetical protein
MGLAQVLLRDVAAQPHLRRLLHPGEHRLVRESNRRLQVSILSQLHHVTLLSHSGLSKKNLKTH